MRLWFSCFQSIFLLPVSSRFEQSVFPVTGPYQSDRRRDGVVSPVSSILPLSAQPESDGRDRSYAGSPSFMCTTAAASQHQADKGTSALLAHLYLSIVFSNVRCSLMIFPCLIFPGWGCVRFGRAVQPADPQPGRDTCDRGVTEEHRQPSFPVFPQFGGSSCCWRQSCPSDHLRSVTGQEQTRWKGTHRVCGIKLLPWVSTFPPQVSSWLTSPSLDATLWTTAGWRTSLICPCSQSSTWQTTHRSPTRESINSPPWAGHSHTL